MKRIWLAWFCALASFTYSCGPSRSEEHLDISSTNADAIMLVPECGSLDCDGRDLPDAGLKDLDSDSRDIPDGGLKDLDCDSPDIPDGGLKDLEDCLAICGDGVCASSEDEEGCPEDCEVCGNGKCAGKETGLTCPADCCPPGMICALVGPTYQRSCFDCIEYLPAACAPPGMSCSGQDGAYPERVRVLEINTIDSCEVVYDKLAGYMWLRELRRVHSWVEAASFCSGLTVGGKPWRLPTVHELATLLDFGTELRPAMDQATIPLVVLADDPISGVNVQQGPSVWTALTQSGDSGRAWAVSFSLGAILPIGKNTGVLDDNYYALCIQGSQYEASDGAAALRFKVNTADPAQKTVTDTTTGLEWQSACAYNRSWFDALAHCEMSEYGGKDDWRLPDIQELLSLADFERHNPASSFPNSVSLSFWSSTSATVPAGTGNAMRVDFDSGAMGPFEKLAPDGNVRCVRGGLPETAFCGNIYCDPGEGSADCEIDCGRCYDGVCGSSEDVYLCPADCPSLCGDGYCTHDETAESCSMDCSAKCGDGLCTHEENNGICAVDCPPVCGDGLCGGTETLCSCPEDCGSCTGCCDGTICRAGTSNTACGKDGLACNNCSGNQNLCIGQICVVPPETWTDTTFGLTWQVTPTGDGKMNWADAKIHCSSLDLDGGGWRLPTISELRKLIRGCSITEAGGGCGVTDECLTFLCWIYPDCAGCWFADGPANGCYWLDKVLGMCDSYWSSSPVEDDGGRAWAVSFGRGEVFNNYVNYQTYVRCVR